MNEDKVISKEELLEKLWNDKYYLDENVLLVNMTRLVSAFLSCLSSISLDFLRCRYAICCIAGNSVHQHTRAFSMVFVSEET